MSTRESGSSTQSTGTSWIRSPLRSARISSSVSKNHSWSSTRGSRRPATSRRIALKPHWASENRLREDGPQHQVVVREMTSRLGPRTTRAPAASRLPMATWL